MVKEIATSYSTALNARPGEEPDFSYLEPVAGRQCRQTVSSMHVTRDIENLAQWLDTRTRRRSRAQKLVRGTRTIDARRTSRSRLRWMMY